MKKISILLFGIISFLLIFSFSENAYASNSEVFALNNFFGSDAETSRVLTWQTSADVNYSVIRYIASDSTDYQEADANRTVVNQTAIYRVELENLLPNTVYNYQIGDGTLFGEQFWLKTKAENLESFSFVHISDSQSQTLNGYNVFGSAVDAIIQKYPSTAFFLHTGDMVDTVDSELEWNMFFSAISMLKNYAFAPTVGNHEQADDNNAESFRNHFTLPSTAINSLAYSFDYQNAHFVVLNSEDDLALQRSFLIQDLQKNTNKWTIVAMHRGVYQKDEKSTKLFNAFADVFDKYGVDLVLSGHNHVYMKTYPLYADSISNDGNGTIYLQSGSIGEKQGDIQTKQIYQEFLIAPNTPTFSLITISQDSIDVSTQIVSSTAVVNNYKHFSIKSKQQASTLSLLSKGHSFIEVKKIDGAVYSLDSLAWQDSNIFTSLDAGTTYTIYARFPETQTAYASKSSQISVKTDSLPYLYQITNTTTSITLNPIIGAEYSIDGGLTWQDSNYFSNLKSGTEYNFYVRLKAGELEPASQMSEMFTCYTLKSSISCSSITLDQKIAFTILMVILVIAVIINAKFNKAEH